MPPASDGGAPSNAAYCLKNSRLASLSLPIRGFPDKKRTRGMMWMSKDLPGSAGTLTAARPHEARSPAPVTAPGPMGNSGPDRGSVAFGRPTNSGPLAWADAVDAAAARLIGSWVNPDTADHMVASGLADEFAATLCAFGMAPAEVAHHMRDRPDEALGGQQRAPQDSHVTPTGGSHRPDVDRK
jgi:hypothetical protein